MAREALVSMEYYTIGGKGGGGSAEEYIAGGALEP